MTTSTSNPLGIWPTIRELGVFCAGAALGAILAPQDSGWWLGIPLILMILVAAQMRRPVSRVRPEWVVTALMLVRTCLGGYASALFGISAHGHLTDTGIEFFTPVNIVLMITCLVFMFVLHILERFMQQHERE